MAFVFTLDEETARDLRTKVYDHLQSIEANGSLLVTEVMVYDHDFPDEHDTQWAEVLLTFEDGDQLSYDIHADPAKIMDIIDSEAEMHGQTVKFGLTFHDPHNDNCLEGVRCPRCGQAERVFVVAVMTISVIDNGIDDERDAAYDDNSDATCPDCGFSGTWLNFTAPEKEN